MSPDLPSVGRGLIVLGALLAGCGVLLRFGPRLPWLGRLPGDIAIQRDGFSFYFPLTSCLLASAVVSLLMWVWGRLHR